VVAYVPSYDPAVVYGPAPYAYLIPYTFRILCRNGFAFGTGIILGLLNNWGNCNWGGAISTSITTTTSIATRTSTEVRRE
jgi:hypothetical protein